MQRAQQAQAELARPFRQGDALIQYGPHAARAACAAIACLDQGLRALLAQYGHAERKALYRRLGFERYSDTTPVNAESVEAELEEAQRRGYHQSDQEYLADLAGVALPLPLPHRRLAIVLAGPVSRCLGRRAELAAILQDACTRYQPKFDQQT